MALRQILTEPNQILREKSLSVEMVDNDIRKLMDDMLETMYAAPGIGLAAIQVGVPKRVIVLDIGWRDKSESLNDKLYEERRNPMYFVNLRQPFLQIMIFLSRFYLVQLKFVSKPCKYK